MSASVSRIVSERNQRTLLELVLRPGNDVCADCKARAPRWASHNLGIFICVNCASIHRKIGTHVTKVKSITLDQWTKDQVEVMKEYGNAKSNALYNPNEARHPPPTNMIDSERDSELEKFIRSKYEYKRFIDRRPLPPPAPPVARKASPAPLPPPKTPQNMPRLHTSATLPMLSHNAAPPPRSASQPLPPLNTPARKPVGGVWDDLISLGAPSQSSSLPLQYSPVAPTNFSSPGGNPFVNMSVNPSLVGPMSVSTPVTPLFTPVLHVGVNPFGHALVSPVANAVPLGSNPFSSAMGVSVSAPTTPGVMPPTAYPFSYPQTPVQSAAVGYPPFSAAAVANPNANVLTPGASSTNPFSAMQMQGGYGASFGAPYGFGGWVGQTH